jgi:hypothetical protein
MICKIYLHFRRNFIRTHYLQVAAQVQLISIGFRNLTGNHHAAIVPEGNEATIEKCIEVSGEQQPIVGIQPFLIAIFAVTAVAPRLYMRGPQYLAGRTA